MDRAATLTNATDYVSLSGGLNVTGTIPNPLLVNGDSIVSFTVSGAGTYTGIQVQPYLKTPNGTWTPVAVVDKQLSTNLSGAAGIAVPDNTVKTYNARFPAGMFVDAKLVLNAITTGPIVGEITSGKVVAGGEVIVVPTATAATTFGAGITFNGATGTNTITIPTAEAVAASISDGTNTYLSINSTTGNATLGATGKTQTINGLISESNTNAITAFAGGGQGSAVALTTEINRVTVCATRGDSVKLPASVAGMSIYVINTGAAALAVFPATGDAINGLSANASVLQMQNSVDVYTCPVAGQWYVEAGGGFSGPFITELAEDTITAFAGGGQASARLITSQTNRVTVVATAGDSIKLPVSAAGLELLIINSGANSMQVYGSGTDTIDGVATATGVSQMANSLVIYSCCTAGSWFTEGLASGYGGSGLATASYTAAVTAFAGGGQASATPLTSMINRVSTVATQGDSVRLPASAPGLQVTVINRGANPLQIYGAGTDTINGIATGTGISQGVNTSATHICSVAGNWEVPLSSLVSPTPTALAVNGAIPAHVNHTYAITKAGVLADTLAAPTAGTDDGLVITVTSDTANAHTITATGLLDTGTASVNVATFAAFKGAGLTLMAYNGRWKVLSSNGVTFS